MLQAGESQSVAAANAGFFEDVFEVDFHRSGADAERFGDLLILQPALHQIHDLQLAWRERGTDRAGRHAGIARGVALRPVLSRRYSLDALGKFLQGRSLSDHAGSTGLQAEG